MSYRLFEMKTRKAAKQHRCIWCGQRIAIGESYDDERSVYDGNVQRHRWHPECRTFASDEIFEMGEEEFTPWDNERPAKPSNPA